MADLSITAANVVPQSGAITVDGTFGATIVAGDALYRDASDNKFKKADANLSAAAAVFAGLALNGGGDGQPGKIITEGDVVIGSGFTVGQVIVLSATAGKLCPVADLATGMYVNVVGVMISATTLRMRPLPSGVAVP